MNTSHTPEGGDIGLDRVSAAPSRGDAWLAALPPVLFGLSLSASYLQAALRGQVVIGGPTPLEQGPSTSPMVAIIVGVAVLAAGALVAVVRAIATRRRLPFWANSWTASAAMGILAALNIAADDVPHLMSPLLDTVVGTAALLLLGVAVGIAGWFGVLLGGLAGVSAVMPISLLLTFAPSATPFRRLDIAMLTSVLGLVFGLLIARFARARPPARWVWLAIGALLSLGTIAAMEYAIFRHWRVSHDQTGLVWILPAVMIALMAFGPVVGLMARVFKPRQA